MRATGPLPALPRHLDQLLAQAPGADRSGQMHALVAAAIEWGFDDGQVHQLVDQHPASLDKYGKRLEREVDRALGKLRPSHPHAGQPCDKAGCPNTPRWMTGSAVIDWPAPRPDVGAQPADEDVPPADVGGFWQERPVLQHIHTFARARMTSPLAVLGVVLTRVLVAVSPEYVLPPLVGGHGSLNQFLAIVGSSGSGKGAAETAGADAVDVVSYIDVQTAGSGEGLVRLFGHRDKDEVFRDRQAVLLSVPEVDNLVALRSRQGATLMPVLRSAWSGEKLGFSYIDQSKAIPLERHSYRLGVILGVQPGRAAPLLDESDGGTPQRFIWMPATDRDAPDETPADPGTWRIKHLGSVLNAHFRARRQTDHLRTLTLPNSVVQEVRDNRRANVRGEAHALDGHAMFARLKVAVAFALLAERAEVTEDDWRLSGVVMAVSDSTRAGVQQHLSAQARTSNLARARADGERTAVAEDVTAEHNTQRCSRFVLKHLRVKGGHASRSEIRRALPSRDRQWFDDALARVIAAGQVVTEEVASGERLRLTEVDK